MRKVVVTTFLSLDGVMENPAWSFPYWNDDIAAFKGEEFSADAAQLIGRITYEGFAQAWPDSKDEGADFINGMPKYVVSTTLEDATWNNSHLIKDNVVEAIQALKNEDGGDLLVSGSGKLVQFLIANDLVDEYHLLVYPVVVGEGQRLFEDGTTTKLKLVESKPLGSVVALIYEPDRTPAE